MHKEDGKKFKRTIKAVAKHYFNWPSEDKQVAIDFASFLRHADLNMDFLGEYIGKTAQVKLLEAFFDIVFQEFRELDYLFYQVQNAPGLAEMTRVMPQYIRTKRQYIRQQPMGHVFTHCPDTVFGGYLNKIDVMFKYLNTSFFYPGGQYAESQTMINMNLACANAFVCHMNQIHRLNPQTKQRGKGGARPVHPIFISTRQTNMVKQIYNPKKPFTMENCLAQYSISSLFMWMYQVKLHRHTPSIKQPWDRDMLIRVLMGFFDEPTIKQNRPTWATKEFASDLYDRLATEEGNFSRPAGETTANLSTSRYYLKEPEPAQG